MDRFTNMFCTWLDLGLSLLISREILLPLHSSQANPHNPPQISAPRNFNRVNSSPRNKAERPSGLETDKNLSFKAIEQFALLHARSCTNRRIEQ